MLEPKSEGRNEERGSSHTEGTRGCDQRGRAKISGWRIAVGTVQGSRGQMKPRNRLGRALQDLWSCKIYQSLFYEQSETIYGMIPDLHFKRPLELLLEEHFAEWQELMSETSQETATVIQKSYKLWKSNRLRFRKKKWAWVLKSTPYQSRFERYSCLCLAFPSAKLGNILSYLILGFF